MDRAPTHKIQTRQALTAQEAATTDQITEAVLQAKEAPGEEGVNPGGVEHGMTAPGPSLTENKNGTDPKDNKKNPVKVPAAAKGKKIQNMLKRRVDRGLQGNQNEKSSKLSGVNTKLPDTNFIAHNHPIV